MIKILIIILIIQKIDLELEFKDIKIKDIIGKKAQFEDGNVF